MQIEPDVVALALEPVHADGQPVTINLIAMTQAGLRDSIAALDLAHEAMDVGYQILVDIGQVLGDDCAQQQATEARRGLDRQHQMAQRDATRRRGRA